MIPVQPQPEPGDFSERVRKPGTTFLRKVPFPITEQWKGKEYWQSVLPDMRKAYKGICAYSAHWISPVTGSHSIDHFVPKSVQPNLAYEWSNFRYTSSKFNSRKGKHIILDPFQLEPDWFVLDFPSLLVKPNRSAAIRTALRSHVERANGPTLADVLAEIRALPSRLTVVACASTPSSPENVGEPEKARANLDGLLDRLSKGDLG